MKKIFKYILLGAVVVGVSSCEKYLDINENPNSPTEATPGLVLPQALVGTAAITSNFNGTLADIGGQRANAGGFGGFGAVVTYEWTNGTFEGLWQSSYDNAQDYQYVIDNTEADASLAYSTSIARIMKSYAFARLVDQYNDVPYFEALKGNAVLTPKFDKGEDIYKDLISQLNIAMKAITDAQAVNTTSAVKADTDPMFKGNMNRWMQFANTLKLRLLLRVSAVPSMQALAATEFAAFNTAAGFLTDDAMVNPGYVKEAGRQSPQYNALAYLADGTTRSVTSRIPTKWIFAFYNGNKISDTGRGSVIYRAFPNTPINQLGDESAGVPQSPSVGTAWFTGTNSSTTTLGLAKGPTQGQPIILAAESYFLQAEAYTKGFLSGDAALAFNNGITASFRYLYKNASDVVDASKDVAADVAAYKVANAGNFLVDFALATSNEQKTEAIITQKYIALNMIHSDEAYNEFRRTGYPTIMNGSLTPTATFASRQSSSSRPDKLPSRILYPQSEFNLNPTNVPTGINQFTSLIFWDLN